jgi:RimJ/RimL family protein N-acetyltransferase
LKTGRTPGITKRKKILVRPPRRDDLDDLLRFINALVDEDAPILMNKKTTLEEERVWLDEQLGSLQKGECIALVAEVDGRVVAHGEIRRHGFRESHVGTLGISVSRDHRDGGIGTTLMSALVERAGEAGLRLIILEVFAGNRRAIHVYKKIGFKIKGRIPGKLSYKGRYSDAILMAKDIVS